MIRPGDAILIAGDSWGCGEWVYEHKDRSAYIAHTNGMSNYGVVHLGLEQYLKDYNCVVRNVSQGGASNKHAIEQLAIELVEFRPDHTIWIQTDPMRDTRPYHRETFPKNLGELLALRKILLEKTYQDLNALGALIHCMGGVTDLQNLDAYDNLIPAIPSLMKFFDSVPVEVWISEWIHHDGLLTEDLLDELYSLPKPQLKGDWFIPDGAHPNRHAHKKIFEFLTC